jgi:hypothetical protein
LVFNSLNNIPGREMTPPKQRDRKTRMILPSRRRIGAVALIVAGIGAFLVPFLLHSPSSQGTSPTPPTPGGNGGGGTNPTSPSGGGGTTIPPSGGSGGSCNEAKSHDPNPHDKGNDKDKGNAFGVVKHKLDNTVALMKAMGKHNPAFHLHHDTDTDNDTIHGPASIHDPGDHDSSCATGEEAHDKS